MKPYVKKFKKRGTASIYQRTSVWPSVLLLALIARCQFSSEVVQ